MGWAIVDYEKRPLRLEGDFVRDEAEQAQELIDVVSIFDELGVDGTFVMTFVAPLAPHSDDPKYDIDMASYSLVRSYGSRLGPPGPWGFAVGHSATSWDEHRLGTVYPEMPWDPKDSFRSVAKYYCGAGIPGTEIDPTSSFSKPSAGDTRPSG